MCVIFWCHWLFDVSFVVFLMGVFISFRVFFFYKKKQNRVFQICSSVLFYPVAFGFLCSSIIFLGIFQVHFIRLFVLSGGWCGAGFFVYCQGFAWTDI